MESRRQHTTRAAWPTTPAARLCSALAVVLAALVVCLACVSPAHSASGTASMTTVSAEALPEGTSAERHGTPSAAAHSADCPSGDVCCGSATDSVRAVLAAPAQPLPAVLPRSPDIPQQPDAASRAIPPAPTARAPDLHVLQVQRT